MNKLVIIMLVFVLLAGCQAPAKQQTEQVAKQASETSETPETSVVGSEVESVTKSDQQADIMDNIDDWQQNGNANNSGLAVQYEDKIVFSDRNGGIYMTDMDGSRLHQLSDKSAEFLTIDEHFLYFSSGSSIYRLNMEDQHTIVLFDGEENNYIRWMALSEDKIYFNNGTVQVMNLLGNAKKTILNGEGINPFYLTGSVLLYLSRISDSEQYDIKQYDVITGETKVINNGIADLYLAQVYNDTIYYLTRSHLNDEEHNGCSCAIQRMDMDGGNQLVIRNFRYNVHSMNLANGWIYFVAIDADYNESLSRISIEQPNKAEVLPQTPTYRMTDAFEEINDQPAFDSPGDLNVAGNWLFYNNVYGHNGYLQALLLQQ